MKKVDEYELATSQMSYEGKENGNTHLQLNFCASGAVQSLCNCCEFIP